MSDSDSDDLIKDYSYVEGGLGLDPEQQAKYDKSQKESKEKEKLINEKNKLTMMPQKKNHGGTMMFTNLVGLNFG
jgi:hypothetical protein